MRAHVKRIVAAITDQDFSVDAIDAAILEIMALKENVIEELERQIAVSTAFLDGTIMAVSAMKVENPEMEK